MNLTRRQLLRAAAAAAVAWRTAPWAVRVAAAQTPIEEATIVPTLEAFADTLIPGEKRHPDDRAVAGVVEGPGAVQAGAVDLLYFEGAQVRDAVPGWGAGLDVRATQYAAQHGIVLDPTVSPFVSLDFEQRTALAVEMLAPGAPDRLAWEALAALVFLAYHTAGHLDTPQAIRGGHPGLETLGFPPPDADGLWRYPEFSYQRPLATPHPHTATGGNPP